jgi:hypothetical protein
VKPAMAVSTKCYEVAFLVVSEKPSGLNMVHLKVFHVATMLAAPGVAL